MICVTDGQEAIDAVQSQPVNYFSIIILDINMPGKNGIQACTEILDYFDEGDFESSLLDNAQRTPQFFSSSFLRQQKKKARSERR